MAAVGTDLEVFLMLAKMRLLWTGMKDFVDEMV